jgi:hypothetical protein
VPAWCCPAAKRVLADDEVDDRDLLAIAVSVRDVTTEFPADQYIPNSLIR